MIRSLTFTFLILVTIVCQAQNQQADNYSSVYELFKNPVSDYRPAPLWVWNDRMTKPMIEEQLTDFKNKGFGGVFIHPRPGLITPYLSNEWFEMYQFTIDICKKLDLKVWIYDENSYPAGFAGGHVPAEMPESKGLSLNYIKTEQPDTFKIKPLIILKKEGEKYANVTDLSPHAKADYFVFPIVEAYTAPRFAGYTYVDLMQKKVTDKFIDITFDKGYKRFKNDYGKTLLGTFMDEPNIDPNRWKPYLNYTPALFDEFQKKWGYDLRVNMPSLVEKTGNWKKVRHDYFSLLNELFIDNWAKVYSDYCKKNNLKLTGHYWDHEWPTPKLVPDNMAVSAFSGYPGIDVLMNNWSQGPGANFGNNRMVKEVRSVANQLGKERVLSETYGASGWDITFKDQKRIADWEYALGIDFVCQHLAYATIRGSRKRDHPQSFSYHEPWWGQYKYMNDYMGRLSTVLSKGIQPNRILVIEPTTTAWMYFQEKYVSNDQKDNKLNNILKSFNNLIDNLEDWNIEYDLGCEYIIKNNGSVLANKFVIGKASYDLVILPPELENFDRPVAEFLGRYLTSGGKILSFTGIPANIDGTEDSYFAKIAEQQKKNFLVSTIQSKDQIFKLSKPEILFGDCNVKTFVFHRRQKIDDAQLLFVANVHETQTARNNFTIRGKSIEKWDLFTGDKEDYPFEQKGDSLKVNFEIAAGGSLLLCIRNQEKQNGKVLEQKIPSVAVPFSDSLKIERTQPNVLVVDYCDFRVNGREFKNQYFYDAQLESFKQHGHAYVPWDMSVQFKSQLIDADTFPKGSGFEADYWITIDSGVNMQSLKLVVENLKFLSVWVNNQPVKPIANQWWLDKDFLVYPLGNLVNPGKNKISIKVSPFSVFSELEPIYVLGGFGLQPQGLGFKLMPSKQVNLGAWNNQGMPFYSNKVDYQHTVSVNPASDKKYFVKLNRWEGSVVEVFVNDKSAGIIAFNPFQLDITKFMIPGNNTINVEVCGSLRNTLGPHHTMVKGQAWPGSFQKIEKGRNLSGESYITLPYGLMEDFSVIRN